MDHLNTNESAETVDRQILRAIKSISYGSVEITIQNSKVVQIEVKEKLRFDKGLKRSKGLRRS